MIFLNTNILVYAYDKDEAAKHLKAKDIVADCWSNRTGSLSTQVLQEFYVTTTRKLPRNLPEHEAREIVEEFLSWSVYQIVPTDIVAASKLEEKYGYSFWDCLVITAAQNEGAEILYSEDMQHGQQIGNVRIVNPFK